VAKQIYQLKITLEGIRPPLWRRVLVDGATPLGKLHRIFQIVMGWHNSHLHAFRIGYENYGEPDPNFDDDYMEDERKVKLQAIAPEAGAKFHYEYDFGDSWSHLVQVEKIIAPEPGTVYPLCIKGKRACPPEDCGGVWGYADLLDALSNPAHEEHEEMLEWVEDDFDPEAFDQNAVNNFLRQI